MLRLDAVGTTRKVRMKALVALTLGFLATAAAAQSIRSKPVLLDFSMERIIDHASAKAILTEGIPARVWKLYPASKWGFATQVEGGVTEGKICVITARAMMVPLSASGKLLLRPEQMATAFDAIPNATAEQCRQLAKDKLKEAVQGVVASLVKV